MICLTCEQCTYVSLQPQDQLAKEWFIISHGLEYYTALATEELTGIHDPDENRVFKGLWTFDLEMVTILSDWLTGTVDAIPLHYDEDAYHHKRQVEIMTRSMTHLFERVDINIPAKSDTQEILKGEVKTAIKDSVYAGLSQLDESNLQTETMRPQEVIILFSDLRDFTSLTKSMEVTDLVSQILNPYLDTASQAVSARGGVIDKFIGDGMLAVFGLDGHLDAEEALNAAVDLLRNTAGLDDRVSVGIGIARGEVLVGEVGSSIYTEKTVIGNAVNIAQHLSDVGKNEIMVSHTLVDSLQHPGMLQAYGDVELRGISERHTVYRVTL